MKQRLNVRGGWRWVRKILKCGFWY